MISRNKFFFIGGDFIESQYLWIIPFIGGYCKKNKIKNIIFENSLSIKIKKNKNISDVLKNFNSTVFKYDLIFFLYLIILFLSKLLFYIKLFFLDNSFFKYNKDSLDYQLMHSYWDTYVRMQKNYFKFNFTSRLKSILFIHLAFTKAFYLNKKKINAMLVGHTVYSRRALISYLKTKGVKIISQANFSFQLHLGLNETRWDFLPKKNLDKLLSNISDDEVEIYWLKRLKGKGNYEDANISAKLKFKNTTQSKLNVLMLHIFRDSPYNFLDKDRIFCDYYEWVIKTLKIINKSTEEWLIRPHPNSSRWGENSIDILNQIIKSTIVKLPKNIKIENNAISMQELYSKTKRIVTYSGTSNIEIACFGIKPIIISETILSYYNENFVLKPKNYEEYKNFLLSDFKSEKFKLKNDKIKFIKKLLYLRENTFSFRQDLNAVYVYRGDNQKIYDKDFRQTEESYHNFSEFLNELGERFSPELTHTISKKFVKYL